MHKTIVVIFLFIFVSGASSRAQSPSITYASSFYGAMEFLLALYEV